MARPRGPAGRPLNDLYVWRVMFYDLRMSPVDRIRSELAGLVNGGALPAGGGIWANVAAARTAGVAEGTIARAVATGLGLRFVESLTSIAPSAEFLSAVPIAFARQHHVLGLMGEGEQLLLAVGDPAGLEQVQIVGRFLNRPVVPVMASQDVVLAAINQAY